MPNLLEVIQEIVKNTNNSLQLTDVLFGTVSSVSPLKIRVEQKLELTEEFLVLTKNVVDYTVNITLNDWSTDNTSLSSSHTHTGSVDVSVESEIMPNDNEMSIENTVSSSLNINDATMNLEHEHTITGTKSITVHNALTVNDKVILIQQGGGQKFVVLDKVY